MAKFSPNVADPELRRVIRALSGDLETLTKTVTAQAGQIRQLQARPVSQNTTVVRQAASGGSAPSPGQLTSDVLGALLPFSDPAPNLELLVPPGTIIAYGGSATPDGWLYCNGSSYAVSEYPDLHAAVGYTWGGAGASFNVPNLVDRYLQGASVGEALGSTFGATDHEINLEHKHEEGTLETLTSGAHTHSVSGTAAADGSHSHGSATGSPSSTTEVQSGTGVTVASDTHTHNIAADGTHGHSVTGTAAFAGGHTHTIDGETDINVYTDVSVTDPVDIRPRSAAVRFLIKT